MIKDKSLIWESFDFKIKESSGDSEHKWLTVEGTALTTGKSKNNRIYTFENLQENDNASFNWIVGHKDDYDNPDHNVGDGLYTVENNVLKYTGKVKNTAHHPDIVEQIQDGLVAPSIHAGAKNIVKQTTESGEVEYLVEGLHAPLIAWVNKHARGVEGATVEAAVMERADISESVDGAEDSKLKEVKEENNMSEELIKENADLKNQLKEMESKFVNLEKTQIVDRILEANSDLVRSELMEKSVEVLKVIETYEVNESEEDETEEVNEEEKKVEAEVEDKKEEKADEGVAESKEGEEETKESNDLKGIAIEEKSGYIHMDKDRYNEFNKAIKESIYR